jgi:DNA polymerase-1
MKTSNAGIAKTLLLVDGSSFLYRAFHAMSQSDLRSPQGEPTGAMYGVLNMLRKLRHDYASDYSLCVFDAKGKTFRDDLYPEYKAHRPPMPDDLARQIEPLYRAIAASGWNILALEGVEADDVIGTLTQQASRDGVRSIVATGDKDLAQLVNEHVTLVNTMSNETLDVPGVSAKFGVPPERIVDYLALTGDAVDNIPGVEKVGPKTAVKWLAQYGTLDNLMQHAGEIGGVVGENLRKALDWLPQARRLVTVKCDVALEKRYDALIAPEPDREKQRELYERYGFKSWLRELSLPSPAGGGGAGGEGSQSEGAALSKTLSPTLSRQRERGSEQSLPGAELTRTDRGEGAGKQCHPPAITKPSSPNPSSTPGWKNCSPPTWCA